MIQSFKEDYLTVKINTSRIESDRDAANEAAENGHLPLTIQN